LKPEIIKKLKSKKIKIIPWTVNSNDDIAEVLNMGVDGIISDYPDRVIKFLYGKEI
jgi:glycerophosphoryl diester phosphodiesterase